MFRRCFLFPYHIPRRDLKTSFWAWIVSTFPDERFDSIARSKQKMTEGKRRMRWRERMWKTESYLPQSSGFPVWIVSAVLQYSGHFVQPADCAEVCWINTTCWESSFLNAQYLLLLPSAATLHLIKLRIMKYFAVISSCRIITGRYRWFFFSLLLLNNPPPNVFRTYLMIFIWS